jgi:hypothetical protein
MTRSTKRPQLESRQGDSRSQLRGSRPPPEPGAQATVLAAITCEEAFMPAVSADQHRQLECERSLQDRREFPGGACRRTARKMQKIADAGLILARSMIRRLVSHWTPHPEIGLAQCRKWARASVRGAELRAARIPAELVCYHTCYSINMGARLRYGTAAHCRHHARRKGQRLVVRSRQSTARA